MFDIKRIIFAILIMMLSAGLAACGRSESEEGYVESGELVVIEDSSDIKLGMYDLDTLNPLETKSESVRKIMNIVYEPLFTLGADKALEPVLASGYSLSQDGTQITVNLKEGVKWQDGTNFTADDVVYTLSKMRSAGGLYGKISDKIRSFTATSKTQVVINFERAEPASAYLLTFPVISKSTKYVSDGSFSPVGTGSYKLESKSSTEMILMPNSIWHGGESSKKRILVKLLKDKNAVAEAFNVSEIDVITSDELSLEAATPKMNSHTEEIVSDKMVFLGFNTASSAVSSVNIRKAIIGLLDKQKILENDAYGHGRVSELAINPSSWAYQGVTAGEQPQVYTLNLIADDGYTLSDGIYYKAGVPLFVRILVNLDNTQRAALADGIADSLKASGFSVTVEKVSYADYIAKISGDDFDMFVGEIEVEPNLNPATMLTASDNYFNFDISGINEVMSRLYGVTDNDVYKSGLAEFMQKFYSDPPYLPLYFRTENVIYGSYVSGTVKPNEFNPYKNIEKWYIYDKDGKESKEKTDE